MSSGNGSIIRDVAVFDDASAEERILGRDTEVATLLRFIRTAARTKPHQVWLSGPPGSGKTFLAKHLIRDLSQAGRVRAAYVNCWKHRTLHAVLDCLVRELRLLGTEKIDTQFKLERLKSHIGTRTFFVALDELDRVPLKERESMLYTLSDVSSFGLLCISNSRHSFLALDERVRSRLSPYMVALERYSSAQLVAILHDRASRGLDEGAWHPAQIHRIAELADGDARIAVATLRLAAQLAHAGGASRIDLQHIESGWTHVAELRRKYVLSKLTPHHALIYEAVQSLEPVASTKVKAAYDSACSTQQLRPIAARTFSKYVSQLVRCGLLVEERRLVWPNMRVLRVQHRARAARG